MQGGGTSPFLFGDPALEPTLDSNRAGSAEAFPFKSGRSGVVRWLSVFVDSRSRARLMIVGIYGDRERHPGPLLAFGSLARPSAGGWNAVTVNATRVSAGATYWLAVLGTGGPLYFRDRSGGPCNSGNAAQSSLSALPRSWRTGPRWNTCPISAYALGAAVVALPPLNTSAPVITGSAVQGDTLSASTGTWDNAPTSFAYQWQDCDASLGVICTNIAGATAKTYKLTSNDVGATVRVVVTASNSAGSSSAASAATDVVTVPPPPDNTALPAISGQTVQGQTLTTTDGSWTGSPTSYAYHWKDCDGAGNNCTNIAGATAKSYTLAASDVGDTIRVTVTAANAGGSTPATSAATGKVTAPALQAPTNTTPPAVSGQAVQGQTLSTSNGSWTGSPTSFDYRWQDCDSAGNNCTDIAGATSKSYTLTASDVGDTLRSVVTASNAGGSTAAASAATGVVSSSGGGGGGIVLPHDPSFVGPSYYSQFAHGPSSSMSFFPIYTYEVNLGQWNQLPARIKAMGVNGVDDAFDQSDQNNFDIAAANGLVLNINGNIGGRSNSQAVHSYAMQDEPNSQGSKYAASSCSPSSDTCAQAYVHDANAYRSADSTRPVWGNFSKDVMEWAFPPSGWSTTQFQKHETTEIGALDLVSSDNYGWTDPYEWDQGSGQGTGHYGAWVYGHAIDRLRFYDPDVPAFGFVECCDSGDGNGNTAPTNEMMPGMIQAAVWNILVHGARGYTYWTTDFWDSSSNGNPRSKPYPGATFYGSWALYGDHLWDKQYTAAQQVNQEVAADAVDLNSPTVSGISASSASGVPVAALGKDIGGKLWLLVQADGDDTHPLSNTKSMTATVQLPSSVPAGTVLNVVGENRTVTVDAQHQITDTFGTTTETPFSGKPITYGYQHHIYAMP